MDKCSYNIKITRFFEILTISAISCNFTIDHSKRFCGFFFMFSVVTASFGRPLCFASLSSLKTCLKSVINVLLWFLMMRNPHNTFQAIASLERYFFPSRSSVKLKHEIVYHCFNYNKSSVTLSTISRKLMNKWNFNSCLLKVSTNWKWGEFNKAGAIYVWGPGGFRRDEIN